MFSPIGVTTSPLALATLANLINSIIYQSNSSHLIMAHKQNTHAVADYLLSTQNDANYTWYILNDDLIDQNIGTIPRQDLSSIVLLSNTSELFEFLQNVNKIILSPRCNSLIVFINQLPNNEIVKLCWNQSLVNVGIVFLIEQHLFVYTYNPFVDEILLEIWNSSASVVPPIDLHSKIFYDKVSNVHQLKVPIMIQFDLASVYRKVNPRRHDHKVGLGGSEVNAMEIVAKSMNATFSYKALDFSTIRNVTDNLTLAFLRQLTKDNEVPFDNGEPIEFDIVQTAQEYE